MPLYPVLQSLRCQLVFPGDDTLAQLFGSHDISYIVLIVFKVPCIYPLIFQCLCQQSLILMLCFPVFHRFCYLHYFYPPITKKEPEKSCTLQLTFGLKVSDLYLIYFFIFYYIFLIFYTFPPSILHYQKKQGYKLIFYHQFFIVPDFFFYCFTLYNFSLFFYSLIIVSSFLLSFFNFSSLLFCQSSNFSALN